MSSTVTKRNRRSNGPNRRSESTVEAQLRAKLGHDQYELLLYRMEKLAREPRRPK